MRVSDLWRGCGTHDDEGVWDSSSAACEDVIASVHEPLLALDFLQRSGSSSEFWEAPAIILNNLDTAPTTPKI
jgi:hypothetical protein